MSSVAEKRVLFFAFYDRGIYYYYFNLPFVCHRQLLEFEQRKEKSQRRGRRQHCVLQFFEIRPKPRVQARDVLRNGRPDDGVTDLASILSSE